MALSPQQFGVLRGMGAGVAVSLAGLAWAMAANPFGLPALVPLSDRFSMGLAADLGLALWLAGSIGWLARLRFVSESDIQGSGVGVTSERARILQALLQNSLEQIGLAVLVHLLWIVLMPPPWLAAVPVSAGLLVLGRLGFSWGYGRGPVARSFGFALGFYPSLLMLLLMLMVVPLRFPRLW